MLPQESQVSTPQQPSTRRARTERARREPVLQESGAPRARPPALRERFLNIKIPPGSGRCLDANRPSRSAGFESLRLDLPPSGRGAGLDPRSRRPKESGAARRGQRSRLSDDFQVASHPQDAGRPGEGRIPAESRAIGTSLRAETARPKVRLLPVKAASARSGRGWFDSSPPKLSRRSGGCQTRAGVSTLFFKYWPSRGPRRFPVGKNWTDE